MDDYTHATEVEDLSPLGLEEAAKALPALPSEPPQVFFSEHCPRTAPVGEDGREVAVYFRFGSHFYMHSDYREAFVERSCHNPQ